MANQNRALARENRKLKRRADAAEARVALERIAVGVGIKDPDYAVTLMTRHLEGKPSTEVDDFDHKKFFENLRGTHPYIFGDATTVPLNTGTGGGAPPPPAPGPIVKKLGEDGQLDVKKMTSPEYAEHLRKRGINPNALS